MAATYTMPVQVLIDELGRLPGIGPKSAQRIAFHLLKVPTEDVQRLADALTDAKARVRFCERCWNIAEGELCPVCSDPRRDRTAVCVVEEPANLTSIERTHSFHGVYHVLGGALSPLKDVGPDDLHIRELVERTRKEGFREVVLATNPDVEGEATALYLGKLLKPLGLRVTRIAQGVPMGGDLEYADQVTLARALAGRREL
jgi:recombination protein RecR